MVFDTSRASDSEYRGRVNIKTLEELFLFMEFNEGDVIIYRPNDINPNYEIRICDYSVE